MARVWDKFLSEQDKAHLEITGGPRSVGFGTRPGLLLIDNYKGAVGPDLPLLEAVKQRKNVIGAIGWRALEAQQELLAVMRGLNLPIVHVTGMAVGNMPGWAYCVTHPSERGILRGPVDLHPEDYEIIEIVAPLPGEFTIAKVAPSAFWGTPLVGLLRFLDIDTLIVVGESTSGCVRATVVDAVANRFRVILAEEGVYDRHEASHAINLFDMNQKYADVLPMTEVIDHLKSMHNFAETFEVPEMEEVK